MYAQIAILEYIVLFQLFKTIFHHQALGNVKKITHCFCGNDALSTAHARPFTVFSALQPFRPSAVQVPICGGHLSKSQYVKSLFLSTNLHTGINGVHNRHNFVITSRVLIAILVVTAFHAV